MRNDAYEKIIGEPIINCPFCNSDHIGTLGGKEGSAYENSRFAYCIACYARTNYFDSTKSALIAWNKKEISEYDVNKYDVNKGLR